MTEYLRSVLAQDPDPIVLCDLQHKILYMNPAAIKRYARFGGEALLGKSLLDCHNSNSHSLICRVLDWFGADVSHNRVHTVYKEQENKDVYMVALRRTDGELIGYYEKHERRDRDATPFYEMA